MGRLVDEQAAGIFRIGMPAAEVVGAVLGVQIPVEVDRGDPADFAGIEQFLDLRSRRRIAIVEGHVDPATRALFGIQNPANLFDRGRHWLFGNDVDAGLQRPHDNVVMRMVGRTDDDQIRLLLVEHRIDVFVERCIAADHVTRAFPAQRILLDDRGQVDMLAPAGKQILAPHGGAAVSRTDQGKTAFFHRMILLHA